MLKGQLALTIALLAASGNGEVTGAPRIVSIHYDQSLVAVGFPSPVLRVTIGHRSALFLIDTGAGVHTFASWFVDAAGLRAQEVNGSTTDSTGRVVPIRVVRAIKGDLDDGEPIEFSEAAVANFPPLFEQHGLGGLLSPQLLANATELAELDLRTPELRIEPFNAPASSLGRPRLDTVDGANVCVNRDSVFVNRLYSIPVLLSGVPASLLVDSGATRTIVRPNSPAGRAIATRAIAGSGIQGVGGEAEPTRVAPDTQIKVAGTNRTIDLTVAAGSSNCGADGLLGMDALRGCTLVLGTKTLAMECITR